MLGKIEDILNKKDDSLDFVSPVSRAEKVEDKKIETIEEEKAVSESENLLSSFENVLNKKDEQKDDNKLDLTRMSSLLNGFHN